MTRNDVTRNGLKIYEIQKCVSDFYSKMFMVVSNVYGRMKQLFVFVFLQGDSSQKAYYKALFLGPGRS
jgi:hypothetical protein